MLCLVCNDIWTSSHVCSQHFPSGWCFGSIAQLFFEWDASKQSYWYNENGDILNAKKQRKKKLNIIQKFDFKWKKQSIYLILLHYEWPILQGHRISLCPLTWWCGSSIRTICLQGKYKKIYIFRVTLPKLQKHFLTIVLVYRSFAISAFIMVQ